MNNKKHKQKGDSIKLASSPCAIDDVDPDYMGLADLDKKPIPKQKIKKADDKKES